MQTDFIVNNLSLLSGIEKEWKNIHGKSLTGSPLISFDYVRMWYETFATPEAVRVYRVQSGNETIGFMPLVLRQYKGMRVLCNLINDHCANPQPLILQDREQEFQRLLLNQLFENRQSWDLFKCGFTYSFSLLPGLFLDDQLNQTGLKWVKNIQPTYSIVIDKSLEEYMRVDLSKTTRKNYRLSRNRLSKHGNCYYAHFKGLEAVQHWPMFVDLEASGWKGTNGTAIKKTAANFQQYYNKVLDILSHSGDLHLFFLFLEKKPIAAGFGCTERNIFQFLKAAYDEEYGKYSPSKILDIYIYDDFAENYPEIQRSHLFPLDYGYKKSFCNEHQECIETIIYSSTIYGRLAYQYAQIKDTFRNKYPKLFNQLKRHLNRA